MITWLCYILLLTGTIVIFSLYLFNSVVRKHRILYRIGNILGWLCLTIGVPLLMHVTGKKDLAMIITMYVLFDGVSAIVIIWNVIALKAELHSKIVTTTLVNCSKQVIPSTRRYNIRLTGTSKEGLRDSFLIQYPRDLILIAKRKVTADTVFIIQYDDSTYRVESIERIN